MKTTRFLQLSVVALVAIMMQACGAAYDSPMEPGDWSGSDSEGGYFDGEPSPGGDDGGTIGDDDGTNSNAGRVTAGEWNDLTNWAFWSNLINGQDYGQMSSYWSYYTNNRIAVRLLDDAGNPQVGVSVSLLGSEGTNLWSGQTDYKGEANLWGSLYEPQGWPLGDTVQIQIAAASPVSAVVTHWQDSILWNEYTYSAPARQGVDIAFVVDATGSMGDEIDFLKDDLKDILSQVQTTGDLRTGAVFYRDEGDEYVTKVSDLTTNVQTTVNFINKQIATGGGDYPEAVHTALEKVLQELSWREDARVKIMFMLLDAPPHYRADVVKSIHASNQLLAASGVHIIPIAASGVDKNTEFILRFLAMTTEGTYVFLTNDSGIGGDHIEASVGDYQVELLNDLMIRLINQYCQ